MNAGSDRGFFRSKRDRPATKGGDHAQFAVQKDQISIGPLGDPPLSIHHSDRPSGHFGCHHQRGCNGRTCRDHVANPTVHRQNTARVPRTIFSIRDLLVDPHDTPHHFIPAGTLPGGLHRIRRDADQVVRLCFDDQLLHPRSQMVVVRDDLYGQRISQ